MRTASKKTHMVTTTDQLDVLFVSEHALWPMDQGFCVHGYHMAAALRGLGLRVAIACQQPVANTAPKQMREMLISWPQATGNDLRALLHAWRGPGGQARRRLAKYQGRNLRLFAGIIPLVERYRPAVVIALGQHGPLMLRALHDMSDVQRVWYAADEPVFFQFSCMRREPIACLPGRLTKTALYAGLEALFVRGLDGAIGVSPGDTRLLKLIGGVKHAVTIRNGVNLKRYRPNPPQMMPGNRHSLVYWGRMDFEPNIDAVTWFAKNVWPALRARHANATWQIVGKNPTRQVLRLSDIPGVEVVGEVDDIRPYAHAAAVTILPVRCGGGIKNKLLEAAAMARPIVSSPRALQGLEIDPNRRPALQAATPQQWITAVQRLWADAQIAAMLGKNARAWVESHHTWNTAAHDLKTWLESLPNAQPLGKNSRPERPMYPSLSSYSPAKKRAA